MFFNWYQSLGSLNAKLPLAWVDPSLGAQMAKNESSSKAPMFDGTKYALWSIRMKTYLYSLGFDFWMSVKSCYSIPQVPPTYLGAQKEYENNAKVKTTILSFLFDTHFIKVMHYATTKETWDKLHKIYEGYVSVKEAKLQYLRAQFENLKMKEEKIANYLQRVEEIDCYERTWRGHLRSKHCQKFFKITNPKV